MLVSSSGGSILHSECSRPVDGEGLEGHPAQVWSPCRLPIEGDPSNRHLLGPASTIRSGRAAGCPKLRRDPPSVAPRLYLWSIMDYVEDLRVRPDIGVVVLLARQSVGSDIHFPRSTYCDGEDRCLVTHRPEVVSIVV